MKKKKLRRAALLGLAAVLLAGGLFAVSFLKERWIGTARAGELRGTAAALDSPDTGFYFIHGFRLQDDMDPAALVRDSYSWDQETRLSLVQINLAAYRDGAISQRGLERLRELFDALRGLGKHFLVRFVYDWDGKNMEVEPTRREIIEEHIAQASEAVNENKEMIFTLQGLFVGNWGEMNGTRYTGAENWRSLFRQLASVTDEELYLAVRMPSQWRQSVSYHGDLATTLGGDPQARRLGLFNDGMMGSESDLGTYSAPESQPTDELEPWHRQEELVFQEELCRTAPNGGEVVYDNALNDFDQAVETLGQMHITYLNRDYDQNVLQKWQAATVTEPGLWQGMDGLTYIQRHLGYRYALTGADVQYDFLRNALRVEVTAANEGFAPAYRPLEAALVLEGETGDRVEFPLTGDLRQLAGNGETGALTAQLSGRDLPPESYRLFVQVRWTQSGEAVALANEGWTAEHGVEIGRIEPK